MFESIESQVVDQVSRHCPRALSTYLICMNNVNENGRAIFSRQEIEQRMSESYVVFRNNLKALAREGILEWHELDGMLHVALANLDSLE